VQAKQPEVLKVTHQDVARQVALFHAGVAQIVKVLRGLGKSAVQVLACAFHFNQQLAAPEHVDPAVAQRVCRAKTAGSTIFRSAHRGIRG
jgi:hypothetical protein